MHRGRDVFLFQEENSIYYTCCVSPNGALVVYAYLLLCPQSLDT